MKWNLILVICYAATFDKSTTAAGGNSRNVKVRLKCFKREVLFQPAEKEIITHPQYLYEKWDQNVAYMDNVLKVNHPDIVLLRCN